MRSLLLVALGLHSGAFAVDIAIVEHTDLAASRTPQTIVVSTAAVPAGEPAVKIDVDATHQGQDMDGIGGAFNEQGWDALTALPADKRDAVLHALFSTTDGAAMRFNRIPIGASDFALSAYSLDDQKDDYELKSFSIKRDEDCLLRYIKAAQAVNPAMKFHASPWSPPGWMKTNGKQTGGGELKSDDRTLKAHADYLVKFLKAYREHGVTIDRLCPQNEPLVAGNYPGCKIPGPLYCKSVREFIVPAVKASGLPTEVWAGTFNYWKEYTKDHYKAVLEDDAMASVIGGISFQYSHLPWVREYMQRHPGVKMQFSESQCFYGQNSPAQALRDFEDFAAYTRAGCRLYTYWNMILPEPHKSTWGWAQNSPVVIDKKTGVVTYQPSYAVARLLARHVVPGAKYLPATVATGDAVIGALHYKPSDGLGFMQSDLGGGDQVVAFAEPDGSTAVYLVNQGPETKARITVKGVSGTKSADAVLPAKSLCAVVVK